MISEETQLCHEWEERTASLVVQCKPAKLVREEEFLKALTADRQAFSSPSLPPPFGSSVWPICQCASSSSLFAPQRTRPKPINNVVPSKVRTKKVLFPIKTIPRHFFVNLLHKHEAKIFSPFPLAYSMCSRRQSGSTLPFPPRKSRFPVFTAFRLFRPLFLLFLSRDQMKINVLLSLPRTEAKGREGEKERKEKGCVI